MNLWVIVPCFNRADLLEACLQSIASQDDGVRVVVADDCSSDGDVIGVSRRFGRRDGWQVRRGRKNVGALANIVGAIRHIQTTEDFPAEDVVLLVDGDDRLAPGAVGRVREAFTDDVDVVYGSYVAEPADAACPPARQLPADVLRFGLVRAFTRDVGAWVNHPIAFRRRAFDVLRDDDFLGPDGEWMRHCYDTILTVPMLEAAGGRVRFLESVNYMYTSDRAESVHRVHELEAHRENQHVLNQPRKYQPTDLSRLG